MDGVECAAEEGYAHSDYVKAKSEFPCLLAKVYRMALLSTPASRLAGDPDFGEKPLDSMGSA